MTKGILYVHRRYMSEMENMLNFLTLDSSLSGSRDMLIVQ